MLTPLGVAAVVGVAIYCVVVQSLDQSVSISDPGPVAYDITGSLRIAALQHATAAGFVLIAIAASVGTAESIESGTISQEVLLSSGIPVLLVRRVIAIMCVGLLSMGLSATAVWTWAKVASTTPSDLPAAAASTWTETVADIGGMLVVMVFVAFFATAIAVVTHSPVATLAVVAAFYLVPLAFFSGPFGWLGPPRWVSELLHLDPFGSGTDYVGMRAAPTERGREAVIGGLVLVFGSAASYLISCRRLQYAVAGAAPT